MPPSAENLRHWEIPEHARFEDTPGGLVRLHVSSAKCTALIYLHGAHVAEFQPAGRAKVLFLSAETALQPGRAIRGGVPVIFPWFGPRSGHPEAPAHGFARTLPWEVESLSVTPEGHVEVSLILTESEPTRAFWPHTFLLRHRITLADELSMTLEVENRGSEAFEFEEALHTYLEVGDVREAMVSGLGGTEYVDKVDGMRRKLQDDSPIRITGETDRVYVHTKTTCLMDDPIFGRCLEVSKSDSATTVVWNPWIAKAAAMSDFGDDEWPRMLCVETANAGEDCVTLPAGGRHAMSATIRVTPRTVA